MGFFSKPFLPYPSMERQDLTQGQLGSFKFTPVDAVQRDFNKEYLTAVAHQEMLSQFQNPVAMASDTFSHVHSNSAGHFSNSLASDGNPKSPTADPAFFDNHIKPDLADSRLKYGPAALRSAVESHSPGKTRTKPIPFVSPRSGRTLSADMNPVASTFVPTAPVTSYGFDDPAITLQALARSLAVEQHAHHTTQVALEDALTKVAELQDEVKKVGNQNKSLLSAVDMLGGIIKHNQHKLIKTPTKFGDTPNVVEPEEDEPVNQVSPIVYDVLARQLADNERRRSEEAEATSVADSVQVNRSTDDSELFNLDLLKAAEYGTSADSAFTRSLRRHFFETPEEDNSGRLSRVTSPPLRADKLISISPDDDRPDKKYNSLMAASQRLQQETGTMPTTPTKSKHSEVAVPQLAGEYETDSSQLPSKPMLQLPASFLAKYKSPSKDQKLSSINTGNDTPKAMGNIAPVLTGPAAPPTIVDTTQDSPTPRRTAKLPQTFDLSIKWKVNRENPVWDDEHDKMLALGHGELPTNQKNSFWKHPVRYIEYADKNLFRTIMIDYIPIGTTYKDVLEKISGGSLESIQLFDPIGGATEYMTARVVLDYELSASTTANHARDHGMKINGQSVRVWQVLTQTWPKNKDLEDDVFVKCYSRILLISKVSDEQLAPIPAKLAFLGNSIIEIGRSYDGLPLIEFTSVAAAVKALHKLLIDPELGSAEFDFEEDPCSEPYPATA